MQPSVNRPADPKLLSSSCLELVDLPYIKVHDRSKATFLMDLAPSTLPGITGATIQHIASGNYLLTLECNEPYMVTLDTLPEAIGFLLNTPLCKVSKKIYADWDLDSGFAYYSDLHVPRGCSCTKDTFSPKGNKLPCIEFSLIYPCH